MVPTRRNRDEWGSLALEWCKRSEIYGWASPPGVGIIERSRQESNLHLCGWLRRATN